jgi:hypothetical protein
MYPPQGEHTPTTLLSHQIIANPHHPATISTHIYHIVVGLQEEQREHGQGKWEGKQKGKSDKGITESKARQNKALHSAQASQIKLRKLLGNAENATRGGDKRRPTRNSRKHGDACGPWRGVKSAVAGEGIPTEEETASTPSATADKSRKTLSA